ncbi:GNAT family N-acetyltransferase [Neolewinella agarilytica]|uniref:GNAT family N-acetyltransferase n=1 Tax=Neolewinella agarilytica TaxID=478744 RepID=UPI002358001C|nr:GNAT family N-acetyltransferase [Neolewinella agarilytica]
MILRQARESDFAHLETFVWQAIFPAFDQPGLTDAQRAENDAMVETARTVVISSLGQESHGVFVALDPKSKTLAGYIIVDASPRAYAEIVQLIVKRAFWGKGVAGELLDLATDFIGRDRAVSLSVRHYNERALAFFAKHDFLNTGETAGNHAIPRSLLLREAYEEVVPPVTSEPAARELDDAWLDFPTASDEPVFEPLPDYNLSIEDEPLFETGVNSLKVEDPDSIIPEESSLTDAQLTELEAFIARARAKKGRPAEVNARVEPSSPEKTVSAPKQAPEMPPSSARKESKPANKHPEVVFEIDYGETKSSQPEPTTAKTVDREASAPAAKKSFPITEPSFEFAFSGSASNKTEDRPTSGTNTATTQRPTTESRAEEKPAIAPNKKPAHKHCPDCDSRIPAVARFCFNCGYPQPDELPLETPAGGQAPEEEVLLLEELPSVNDNPGADTSAFTAKHEPTEPDPVPVETTTSASDKKLKKTVTPAELKQAFRNHLQDRILAYFGERKLKKYLSLLEENTAFQQVRDGSLTNLATWLNERQPSRATRNRRRDVLADLAEYFIVETAAELSNHVLPQRLLRYQSIDWDTVDLFRLVMDYLDFDSESEQVYTDFVAMPTRALKNASRSFLRAAKDERIFFICDQSLISSAKNGFAITDSGIYWKNVLQPAGAATFTTLKETRLDQGHVIIDGQFFDAGNRLNLKVAVLLDKLRRMH